MKKIVIFISIIFFTGCKTTAPIIIQNGTFVYKYKDVSNSQLVLNSDKSFCLSFSYKQGCDGKWEYISKDTIVIKCQPVVHWTQTISMGYLDDRQIKIKILNNNKLKMFLTNNGKVYHVILERTDF